MFDRKLTLETTKYSSVLDVVRGFARAREYAIEEKVGADRFSVVLIDKKADSALGMSTARVFFGGFFSVERIRIVINGETSERGVEVSVHGDVLLNEWNRVDDRPRKGDAARCERLTDDLADRLVRLKDA